MNKEAIQHKIKFIGYKIYDFSIQMDMNQQLISNELNFNISTKSKLNGSKGFFVDINIDLTSNDKSLNMMVNTRAEFETENEIFEDFLSTNLVTINAPAIVFPFIRAFISTVTVNSGYNPIILPTINFVQLKNDFDSKK